jgi:hypothetical protein
VVDRLELLLPVFVDDTDEVNDGVASSHAALQRTGIENVAFDLLQVSGSNRHPATSTGLADQSTNFVPVLQQSPNHVRSDEPASAGEKDNHAKEATSFQLPASS